MVITWAILSSMPLFLAMAQHLIGKELLLKLYYISRSGIIIPLVGVYELEVVFACLSLR